MFLSSIAQPISFWPDKMVGWPVESTDEIPEAISYED